jgi:GTP-binding protein
MSLPTIALVGRTNVGKSTLFNRLLEQPKALVSDIAGTTRDRNEGVCLWRGKAIEIVDTGGLDIENPDEIEKNILKQAQKAIKRADLLLLVVDLKAGAMPQDIELARRLRKSGRPVIIVGNKAEKVSERLSASDPEWRLNGFNEPMAVSSVRGTGVGDLLDEIFARLEKIGKKPADPFECSGTKVAVIGKPNVGKSTLLNSLIGEERFITSPIAHTTREPNDTLLVRGEKNYIFIDTAGMRKKSKVKKTGGLEAAAVKRNEEIVRQADVVLFIIDATEPIGTQEKTLAGFLKESKAGVIVVVNKWDLVSDKKTDTMNRYREYIAAMMPFLGWAPVIFVSALTKQRVENLFGEIDRVAQNRKLEIPQEDLERFLVEASHRHAPSKGKGPWFPKILGIKQTGTNPPTFDLILKAKRTDSLNVSYVRFLENRLREHFNLTGAPLRINIRLASAVSK